ncbi:gamma-glutamylcyclotransferase family protein [Chroogloeocystis siderophila]|uniref:gamma-glutamylcyclotransferase family protein n=1 Tax=Chroogloeocystis siderophila TaxID=329163 RepID=UPI001F1A81C5|nr:gamma-glutamylcyclotransferase [Chroogloeocystis siderophila]
MKLKPVDVFVYGTLKPGETNYQRYCADKVLTVKPAIAFGQLYHLPFGYPAMTAGENRVQGFVLSFADAEILTHLDLLEDYNPHRPIKENEYYRQQIDTYNLDLTFLTSAWAYFMTLKQVDHFGANLLPDGWWSGCISNDDSTTRSYLNFTRDGSQLD